MENKMGDWEQKNLVNELTRGKELARQLQILMMNDGPSSSSSQEAREILIQRILASYEKVFSMLNWAGSIVDLQAQASTGLGIIMSESPPSLTGSPRSEDSDREQDPKDASKKRKSSLPRWTQQVRVNPGMGLEGPLDDGFSWRKYGQKDILGAKFPRGYYRCTHRNVQGCLATKQVQRSDEDPTIFEITYRGRHTCAQASNNIGAPSPSSQADQRQQPQTNQQLQALSSLSTSLTVVTQDLEHFPRDQTLSAFHFPSFSPSFLSPQASGTNYFSAREAEMGEFGSVHQNLQESSEIAEMIPAATTSATNSPTVASLDFPFGSTGIDPNFTFDNSGFF